MYIRIHIRFYYFNNKLNAATNHGRFLVYEEIISVNRKLYISNHNFYMKYY